jgi:protein-S-isoprenylcysteine O-methyltransferase Ste14
MKASAFEFRLRLWITAGLITLGFWAPWIEAWGIGSRISLLEWTALEMSRLGLLPFTIATPIVIGFSVLIAAIGAALRIWGSAWLGPAIVQHRQFQAGSVMADGPYRYVRNPLYIGTWCMVAAMAFLMPPTGALFAMALITMFQLRLIFAEEAFLTLQLGQPYQAYLNAVPRLIPRLRTTLPRTGRKPHWLHALFSEITPIGVFIALAGFSWSYNHWLVVRVILVSFGVSLVVRAIMPGLSNRSDLPE